MDHRQTMSSTSFVSLLYRRTSFSTLQPRVPSVIFTEGTTHRAGVQLLPTKDPYLSVNKAQKKWFSCIM